MFDSTYLFQDRPLGSQECPPAFQSVWIESYGHILQGLCLRPGGATGERHPIAILLHGFPGLEQNRDLAQALRRCGMITLVFHYRGCWGSHGDYRFTHLPEDLESVLAYVREHADDLAVDLDRIYIMAHSMGCFATLNVLSRQPQVKGAVCMAPCDIATMYNHHRDSFDKLVDHKEPFFHLDSKQVFYDDCAAHEAQWPFPVLAQTIDPALPLLFIGGLQDAITPPDLHIHPILETLRARGSNPEYIPLDAIHTFDSHRITLIRSIGDWVQKLEN